MSKRNTINSKIQIPSVFQNQIKQYPPATSIFTAPMTPHNPVSLTIFSPTPPSQDSIFAISSPQKSHSPKIAHLPISNPFLNSNSNIHREGCSIGPKYGQNNKDENCCVSESRSSMQFHNSKKIPNTLTAKIGITKSNENNYQTSQKTYEIPVATVTIRNVKSPEKMMANTEENVLTSSIIIKSKETKTLKQLNKLQENNTIKRYLSCGGTVPVGGTFAKTQKINSQPNKLTTNIKLPKKDLKAQNIKVRASKLNIVPKNMISYLQNSFILDKLSEFLGLHDYIQFMQISAKVYNRKLIRNKIIHDLLCQNFPYKARRAFWISKCQIPEIARKSPHGFSYYCSKNCEHSSDIEKDLDRTFPRHHRFYSRPENPKRLAKVLRAFAVKKPEIGYIQGLNFIAGHLLLQFTDEVFSTGF